MGYFPVTVGCAGPNENVMALAGMVGGTAIASGCIAPNEDVILSRSVSSDLMWPPLVFVD